MGKGSKQRPTDHDAFSANFDAIFGKKEVIKEADVVKEEKEENEDDDEEDCCYEYECCRCGKLTSDEVSTYEVIDREPYGDQTVDRVSYEASCDRCGSDDIEEL